MAASKDLTGRRFGKLVVVSPKPNPDNPNTMVWRCICDCGNIVTADASSLQNMTKKSCGCLSESEWFRWNDERDRILSSMFRAGRSAREIAQSLGTGAHAVRIRLDRLGLKSTKRRASKSKPSPEIIRPRREAHLPQNAVRTPLVSRAANQRSNRLELEPTEIPIPNRKRRQGPFDVTPEHNNPRACQWPTGDAHDGTLRFCNRPTIQGRPYCEEHNDRSFARNEHPGRRINVE